MPGGKLPPPIAFDQSVSELHNAIERLAVCCSFHTRFSENDGDVVTVKSRDHIVTFEHVIMDLSAPQLVNFIRACPYLAIRKCEREISGQHALERGGIRIEKCFARLELEHVLFSGRLVQAKIAMPKSLML